MLLFKLQERKLKISVKKTLPLILIRTEICKMSESTNIQLLKEIFVEWDQILLATISKVSVMIYTYMCRVCLKG